jgi:hypothetical protein
MDFSLPQSQFYNGKMSSFSLLDERKRQGSMIILAFHAEYGDQKSPVPATAQLQTPSSSAYIPLSGKLATLTLSNQWDLGWLTIMYQNWYSTVHTALQTAEAKDQALAAWHPSSWALLKCFTPFLMGLMFRLDKIQVSWRQGTKCFQSNEKQYSRVLTVGRASVFAGLGGGAAPAKFSSSSQPPQFEFGGSNASTTEVRPC